MEKIIFILFVFIPLINADYYEDVLNLRAASNHNPLIRPDETLNVFVRFNLLNIMELDTEEQRISLSGWFTLLWNDLKYDWEVSNTIPLAKFHRQTSEVWKPDLVIENVLNKEVVLYTENVYIIVHHNQAILWDVPVTVDLFCAMDVTYFPFDTQTCEMTVTSWSHTAEELPLWSMEDTVNIDSYRENPLWSLESTQVSTSNLRDTVNSTMSRSFSKITFTFNLMRKTSSFYVLSFVLPVILFSGLCLLTFFMPIISGERMTYAIVVCLAYWLVYVKITEAIPPSTDTPLLSVYIAVVAVKIVLHVLLTMISIHIYHREGTQDMSRLSATITLCLMKITCVNATPPDTNASEMSSSHVSLGHDDDLNGEQSPIENIQNNDQLDDGMDNGRPSTATTLPDNSKPRNQAPQGRLSPLRLDKNNKVWPVNGLHNTNTVAIEAGNLAGMEAGSPSGNEASQQKQFHTKPSWKQLASSCDRLFFCVFVLVSFIVHLTFVVMLGIGPN